MALPRYGRKLNAATLHDETDALHSPPHPPSHVAGGLSPRTPLRTQDIKHATHAMHIIEDQCSQWEQGRKRNNMKNVLRWEGRKELGELTLRT